MSLVWPNISRCYSYFYKIGCWVLSLFRAFYNHSAELLWFEMLSSLWKCSYQILQNMTSQEGAMVLTHRHWVTFFLWTQVNGISLYQKPDLCSYESLVNTVGSYPWITHIDHSANGQDNMYLLSMCFDSSSSPANFWYPNFVSTGVLKLWLRAQNFLPNECNTVRLSTGASSP